MKEYQTYLFDLDGTLVFSTNLGEVRLYPGVIEMLKRLKLAGKKLGLVTVSSRSAVEHYAPDLMPYFDEIITADNVIYSKPDPEGVKLAISKLAAIADTTVMIGDSDRDLAAAQNAGIDRILFSPGGGPIGRDLEYVQSFKPVKIMISWEDLK